MTSGVTGGDVVYLEARMFVRGSEANCDAFHPIRERTRHAHGGRG